MENYSTLPNLTITQQKTASREFVCKRGIGKESARILEKCSQHNPSATTCSELLILKLKKTVLYYKCAKRKFNYVVSIWKKHRELCLPVNHVLCLNTLLFRWFYGEMFAAEAAHRPFCKFQEHFPVSPL